MDWTEFTVPCGNVPNLSTVLVAENGNLEELLPCSLLRAHIGGRVCGGSSSLVITEVMAIFYDGTREAGVVFKPLRVLTRERIGVVLNFKSHFQSLGRPWLRQHFKLGEFLLPYC